MGRNQLVRATSCKPLNIDLQLEHVKQQQAQGVALRLSLAGSSDRLSSLCPSQVAFLPHEKDIFATAALKSSQANVFNIL